MNGQIEGFALTGGAPIRAPPTNKEDSMLTYRMSKVCPGSADTTQLSKAGAVGRRDSISAESVDPSAVEIVSIPKSDHEKEQIKQFIRNSPRFLFKYISEENMHRMADAMQKQDVAGGVTVIQQGEAGESFYLVSDGELEVFRKRGEDAEEKVAHYGPGDSFGELALMYICPRAATVKAITDCTLWTLDRLPFRALLFSGSDEIPTQPAWENSLVVRHLFKKLGMDERTILANSLELETLDADDLVLEQGDDEEDCLYIVESGTCEALLDPQDGTEPVQCKDYVRGMYFGKLAMLQDNVTIKVTSKESELLKMPAEIFHKYVLPITSDLEAASNMFDLSYSPNIAFAGS